MYEYRLPRAQGPRPVTLELNGNPTYKALSYDGSTSQAPIFSTASIKDEFQYMLLISKKINPICPIGNLSTSSYQFLIAKRRPGVSRKSGTTFGQGTILEPSTPHIGREVALVVWTAALVYIYARISQIAEIHTSFYTTQSPHSSSVHMLSSEISKQDAQRTTIAQALLGG